MQNRVPFLLLASSFILGAPLMNAQNAASKGALENWTGSASRAKSSEATSATLQNYAKLPLSFEKRGMSEFVAQGQGYAVDLHGAQVTIALDGSSRVEMEFIHGRQVSATPENELPGKVNYILGNDPRQWRLGLRTYERVKYHELYPGIDAVYYGNQKQLEFDLVLKPGADLRSIRMRFSGTPRLDVDQSGSLVLGDLRLVPPKVIQGNKTIPAKYKVLKNSEVAFEVGAYDRRQPLVIDPTLVYSTRLGGGNGGNQGNTIALDASGNAYIAGYTNASDFPVVNPAYAGYQANTDAFISKLNAAGTALIYSTYIGGSNFDYLYGIGVDSSGAAWAVGYTTSSDFPLLTPYQNTLSGTDAVVVKLNPSGSLAYSTFLGGPGQDIAYSVAVDPFGNAYVTGYASAGFPTTAGVYQAVNQGSVDAFVTKFNSSNALVWSTFVGGASFDFAQGIAVDQFGNSYITGETFSTSFPGAPPGGAQGINRGSGDAFVAKLNFNGSALVYFTFLGGSGTDSAQAIAVDSTSGIAVLTGSSTSTDLATSVGALQSANAGGYDGFVAKLNAAGSAFVYSTYLGGNRRDILLGIALDPSGNAYVAGYTDSNTFPTNAAIQPAVQGNSTSLFRTLNTGTSWTAFDTNLSGAVIGFSPDPVNAGTFIASTDNGTYRSVNGGATWTQQTVVGYMTLARSPASSSTIYGTTGSPIYQSTDNGVTWLFKSSWPQCCAADLIADPTNASTAYAIGGFNSSFAAIQKTVNGGINWNPATTGLPSNALVTAMVAGADGSLYVGLAYNPGGSPGGVYKSTDHGSTWLAVNNGLHTNFPVPTQGLVVAPSNPSILYVDDYFTLYKSTNGGATWTIAGSLPGGNSALGISNIDSATLYYADYNSTSQMWVSTNSGVTWGPSAGIGVAYINRIIGDSLNGAAAYGLSSVSVLPVVAKIDSAGQNLLYSTYLGEYGAAYGIATDGTGDVFVAGSTYEFPTTPAALQRNKDIYRNNLDAFVAKISDATAACSYSVDPPDKLEVWYTHLVHYVVTAPSGCAWTASSNQPWASIASGNAGVGSGIVYVLVGDDETAGTRSATLTIGGQNVTLRQRPGSCGYNIFSPDSSVVPGSGGAVIFNILAAGGCDWSITNNDPTAVTIISGASGTGNGTATLNVAPNLSPNSRTFIIGSPQGNTETISQAGTTAPAVVATITSSPSGASIAVTGNGCIPGTYTTPANLTWNANTNCTVYFVTPISISGTQYVFNSATVNGGASTTTNPLTVNSGGSALTINGNFMNPCTYSLVPGGQGFGPQGGLGSFTVNTASACSWSAVPSAGWITILPSGSHGTANVNYAIAANSGVGRVGTISVGGQHFNIDQAALTCTYSIGPAAAALTATGGDTRVVVNAPAGCSWTAVSNAGFLSVTSGASGAGNGAVTVHIAANTGGARSGTVTIAGQTFSVTQAAPGATACGAFDVTSQVAITDTSHSHWIPPNEYSGSIVVRNNSGAVIHGPVYVVLVGEPTHYGFPNDSFLLGSQLETTCFTSQGDYLLPVSFGDLQPGQTGVYGTGWITQTFGRISYSIKVLSGTPSH